MTDDAAVARIRAQVMWDRLIAVFERIDHPARGRDGGLAGAPGRVGLTSGVTLKGKGHQVVPPGECLRLEMPGGGGLGDPKQRPRDQVREDLADGLISPEAAERIYGLGAEAAE